MEEAITEDAPADAEAQEAKAERPLERTVEEADLGHSPSDRGVCYRVDNKYSESAEYKEESKGTNSRPSTKKSGGLERAISDIENKEEHLSAKRPAVLVEYIRESGENEDKDSVKREKTPNGSLAFIYHKNRETGEDEYLFEQTRLGCPGGNAGKIKLIGGGQEIGEASLETLIRELGEEFESHAANSILIKTLNRNPNKYTTVVDIVNGEVTLTDIYDIEVESKREWDIVKASGSAHDAGNFRVLTGGRTLSIDNQYFAFGWGDMIKEFIRHNSSSNKFSPFTYADSIIPKHAAMSLQLLSSKGYQQYMTLPK